MGSVIKVIQYDIDTSTRDAKIENQDPYLRIDNATHRQFNRIPIPLRIRIRKNDLDIIFVH